MKVRASDWICINHRVFLVGSAAAVEFAVKPQEQPGVQSIRETGRSEGDVIDAFVFASIRRIRERPEGNQRLNSRAPDNGVAAIRRVVGRKAVEFGRPSQVGSGEKV